MPIPFCSLHNHTEYSTLDGLGSPKVWAEAAKALGMDAIGITDHGSISGAIQFYKACTEEGIKPIIGCEVYVVADTLTRNKDEGRYHALVLAKNMEGYKSLLATLNEAHENFFYKPRVSLGALLQMDNVVVTTACVSGLIKMASEVDRKIIPQLKEAHGDDFYLEIQPHNFKLQRDINQRALRLSKNYKIPLVTGYDSHYPTKDYANTHEVLLAMQTNKTLEEYRKDPWFSIKGLWLPSSEMIERLYKKRYPKTPFKYFRQSMEATIEIAGKCDLELKQVPTIMPPVNDPEKRLLKIVEDGLIKRFGHRVKGVPKEYWDRYKRELAIIKKQGFLPYFMVVKELLDWCDDNGIGFGCGRGSVGGSLVAYLMGIHKVDPLRFGLIFERFLTEDRISPPDIDIDFAQDRREEVVEHLREKYGEERVANISTFLTMKSKAALKDVARTYGIPFQEINNVTRDLPDEFDLETLLEESSDLQVFAKRHPAVWKHALKIEGQIKGYGRHAAGVVVSAQPLREMAVIEKRSDITCVNWDMNDAEFCGLLKIDVLGLRTVSVIKRTFELIGDERDIWWLAETGLDDEKVLAEFSAGNTDCIFQYEREIRQVLRDLAPIKSFDTLAAASALCRPGPKETILQNYIDRYHGREQIVYPHPKTEKFLEDTFGLMTYQEQVMSMAHEVAGFTLSEADKLRKAIGKKKKDLMQALKSKFIKGCVKYGKLKKSAATVIWDQIEHHAGYGFNRAHAIEYSLIAYVSMWLKVYYPRQFMCAMLEHTFDTEKLSQYIHEARRLRIMVDPPNIYRGESTPTITKRGIMAGFLAVKGVGPAAVEAIEEAKPFSTYQEFIAKVEKRKCNKKVVKALASAGAIPDITDAEMEELFGKDLDPVGREEAKREALGPYYSPHIILSKMKVPRTLAPIIKRIRDCHECKIPNHTGCNGPINPEKGKEAKMVVVGEAPGRDEDKLKKPFVGKSGIRYLEPGLKILGMTREDVYITNMWMCRPANNKLPENPPADCQKHLTRQITALTPQVVIATGKYAARFFGLRGSIVEGNGKLFYNSRFGCWVLPVVHPGWAMRNGPKGKKKFLAAFKELKKRLEEV